MISLENVYIVTPFPLNRFTNAIIYRNNQITLYHPILFTSDNDPPKPMLVTGICSVLLF